MKRKLFNKIFISFICLTILFTDTVLAESVNIINFKEYLLNSFEINNGYEEYEEYSTERAINLEESVNSLLEEHISNVIEYSEIKSNEVEMSLIEYGNSVKENVLNELNEIKNNIGSNIDSDSNSTIDSDISIDSDSSINNDNFIDIDENNNVPSQGTEEKDNNDYLE